MTRSRAASVAEHIGREIASGHFRPGTPLPIESELAETLDVGRTSVREGIKVLAGKGLVETRTRRGTEVRPIAHWNLFDPDVMLWAVSAAGSAAPFVDDLIELRTIVEPASAELAAERATRLEAARLLAAAEEMDQWRGDDPRALDADLEFHRLLAEGSHNTLLASFTQSLSALLRWEFELAMRQPQAYEQNVALHRAVADAIVRRDGPAAGSGMRTLIEANRRDLGAVMTPTHDDERR
jgi:DNA-binding FadR family transcriptional regulator